jgi:hypothetical protein
LKYGADVALAQNDLAIGYVTNISKAGCFVQIGHNCTVRAGLNELSDNTNFNFETEMPIGRLVVGRITKVDSKADFKRFHFSTRQSLTVYGVGVVDRAKLSVGDKVEAIVMATAEGKAFAQIKGTYIKLKVKEYSSLKAGDQILCSLTKVTKEKITSHFVSILPKSEQMTQEQKVVDRLYQSIQEETQAELENLQTLSLQKQPSSASALDQSMLQNLNAEEQINQKIRDLDDLE